jgi:uncharacterized protein involved in response to NO
VLFRSGFSHAYYGAIRHAITVGFVSLMIVGVASKVVPTLNGVDIRKLSSLWVPFALINAGCLLRVSSQILTDFTASSFPFAGASGVLEVTGLAIWGVHLSSIMLGWGRAEQPESVDHEGAKFVDPNTPIVASDQVAVIIDRFPELLQVFVGFGFQPLTNPLLRRTLARGITIEKACRFMGQDCQKLLEALNAQRHESIDRRFVLPIVPTF